MAALALTAGCATATTQSTSSTTTATTPMSAAAPPSATSTDAYGDELAALDAVYVATIDTYAALSDHHTESRDHFRAAIPAVMFSWIVYKSRAHRDRVIAKVMKDPRLADMMDPKAMPFDVKRMLYGGFRSIVEA